MQWTISPRKKGCRKTGIVIRPGAETRDIRLQAVRGVVLEVTVFDPDGKPVAGSAAIKIGEEGEGGAVCTFGEGEAECVVAACDGLSERTPLQAHSSYWHATTAEGHSAWCASRSRATPVHEHANEQE